MTPRKPVLAWTAANVAKGRQEAPCRHCGGNTMLREGAGDEASHSHKTCAELALQKATEAATAAYTTTTTTSGDAS